MDIQKVLKLADDIVFSKTQKHLDNLQESILRGTWQGYKYPEIAKTCHRSEAHVKKIASKLWKLLSETLGEDINQSNLRYAVERWQFSQPLETPNLEKQNHETSSQTQPKIRLDLSEAPDHQRFNNRNTELSTLKQWILENRTRVVTLLGLTGMGKTALTLELLSKIQAQFDYILWRSLHHSPTVETLQTNIIQFFYQQQETTLTSLIEYLRSYRCLIILDDIQMILSNGKLAGYYRPGYENYGTFFKQLATSSHHSCIILLSWEKPQEIAVLESQNHTCKTLQLTGLALTEAEEILREKGLEDPDQWSELIKLYQGNPSWLNIVAAMIQDLFSGSVSQFLSYKTLILGDLESLLNDHFYRLSDSEKQVLFALANQAKPMEISTIKTHGELSPSALLQAVQSLERRLLIEKVKQEEKTLFTLAPVWMEYVKNQHQH